MARTRKQPPTETPETPIDPPKRKRAVKPQTVTVEDLKASQIVTTAAELPPPEPEYPTFASKAAASRPARPIGPRKRNGEPAASFASDELRIIKDAETWQLRAERELTGVEKDRLAASGFQAVDDSEQVWNASQRELRERGTDINHVAFSLGKGEGRGR
jgi:hypothetical protein